MRRRKLLMPVLLAAVVAATGCAYPISKGLRERAGDDLSFREVLDAPEEYKGETVIWGGKILECETGEGTSVLVILQTPLDFFYEPQEARESAGRFMAASDRFLDPEVYQKDRSVTIGGEVTGQTTRKVGGASYTYPTVRIEEIYLWRERRERTVYHPHVHWGLYYGDPYWY